MVYAGAMFGWLIRYFRTAPDLPVKSNDLEELRPEYEAKRWSVFLTVTFGYGLFYVCRLSIAVAKDPILEQKVFTAAQLGKIGSALFFTYAFGKLTNGFLADRSNIRKFMSAGLMISALINLFLGFNETFLLFAILWGINGWFQSMGSAPSVASLAHWFSDKERGTRYGVWSMGHNLGEAVTFIGISFLVANLGWRWGFWGPGLLCMVVAIVMFYTLKDRPQTYGLPPVEVYKKDTNAPATKKDLGKVQMAVLKNPAIWVLGMASACMYVARYAINNWGILYLQRVKDYPLTEAGGALGVCPIFGAIGAASSGFISDRLFKARRNMPALLFGLMNTGALILFYLIPPGNEWLDILALALFGYSMGALLVYLGGLMAVDLSSKNAAGAAMGLIGVFSYLGAAIQDWISGALLESSKTVVDGKDIYNFDSAFTFWIGATIASFLLALTVWKAKRKE